MQEDYDVVIIGAGPAGLTAGLYASRARLNVIAFEKMMPGGQLSTTDIIENYPGLTEPVSGLELAERMKKQAETYGLKIESAEITGIEEQGDRKIVTTKNGRTRALAVIVASGALPMKLGVKGEDKFMGRGISFCATCDGPFYKDKRIVVVGGSDTAVKEGLFLAGFASSVTFVHRRGMFRAEKVLQDRIFAMKDKIDVRWHSVVEEIQGDKTVSAVLIKDVKSGKVQTIETDGVFLFVGYVPDSVMVRGICDVDEKGYILTDEKMQTSAKGIFACGDVRKRYLRQVVTACGEGAVAAFSAQDYIDDLKGNVYE